MTTDTEKRLADDLVKQLNDFQHMMPEGGSIDPLIEVFQSLAKEAADAIDRLTAELEHVTVQYQGVLASIDNQSASAVNGLQAKLAEMTAERDAAGRVINGIDARSAASDCGKFRLLLSEDYERIRALSPSTLNKPE